MDLLLSYVGTFCYPALPCPALPRPMPPCAVHYCIPYLRVVAQLVELLQAVHDVHITQLKRVAPLEVEGSSNVVTHPLQLEYTIGEGGGGQGGVQRLFYQSRQTHETKQKQKRREQSRTHTDVFVN